MEKNYIIFNVSELNKINFDEVLETSAETLRKSIDEQKTFIKWGSNIPNFVTSLETKEGAYSKLEMIEILKGVEWCQPTNFLS